ncbi:MAG: maleylpyruvate isomerase N-terminal domain-containing protein, partial [Bifidobacteriaceae bacterium]|nr:maleylpyruvate isomerase N-terminal domain-containing protein [Bifidobacteriaceae bacterium]
MTDSAVDYLKPGWEQVAQAELRERQGKGARYDAQGAPHELLSLARRGTAYFLRQLNQLSDEDLDGPSGLPGWSRRHLVAHVGYNARALAHLAYWARTGIETPMYASPTARDDQIRLGASLPARALRHLIDHSWIHLNVEWRDLTTEQWGHHVQTFQGRDIEA